MVVTLNTHTWSERSFQHLNLDLPNGHCIHVFLNENGTFPIWELAADWSLLTPDLFAFWGFCGLSML